MSRSVQVVLTEELPHVGESGQLVRVKAGFARNFLIPRGLAAMATKHNVAQIEHEKRVAAARAIKQRAAAVELHKRLDGTVLAIKVKTDDDDRMYGSVTARDIEELLAKKDLIVDRRKLVMDPIKACGTHTIPVKIAPEIDAVIKVDVSPEEGE